jgi:hypothetical protein
MNRRIFGEASLAGMEIRQWRNQLEITIMQTKSKGCGEWIHGDGRWGEGKAIIEFVETHCSRCKAVMSCKPEGACWCKELPALPMPTDDARCLCRKCLEDELKARGLKVSEQT